MATTPEAMSTFRMNSVDFFPYAEAILHINNKELTIRFSGSEIQPSIAIHFTLTPSSEQKSEQIEILKGRFLS